MTDTAPAPARAWKVVLDKIETDLIEGRLGPGDRLPSERDLVAQLGVGRSSVREALRVLEVMGLIRTGTGSGPSAGAIVISSPTGGMSALLRLQVAAQGFPIEDVVATRLFVEEWIVGTLAAQSDTDLAVARATIDAMDAEPLPPEDFLALDAQFHYALAAASGNTVVAATMAGLRSSIQGYTAQIARHIEDWGTESQRLRDEHHAILEAIEAGDVERARALVPLHIAGYYTH
ncbi:FadR/GntR family transcriptional regulator [Microbacterium sp. zg-YB36]|uniref:FadR/GntR family transcriptional regulator n=1 Tax=Microbacterium sp. zg-YB36 TaxID=2969407 RepID=UPI00214B99D0|nr:FadR/GntR family transcriptional regulator [Microbacterium sp. zg-YB36]MDL5351237.1 FadR/GntR family transcriptional regulator [Microbacterium sp. zg-YB36]